MISCCSSLEDSVSASGDPKQTKKITSVPVVGMGSLPATPRERKSLHCPPLPHCNALLSYPRLEILITVPIRASRRRSSRRLTGSRRRGSGAFFELEPTLQPNLTNSLDRPGPGVSVSDGGSLKEGPSWPQVRWGVVYSTNLYSSKLEFRTS